jgi:hypothetical protein
MVERQSPPLIEAQKPPSLQWYKIVGREAHQGAKRENIIVHFAQASNAVEALELAQKKIRGWKRKASSSVSSLSSSEMAVFESLLSELGIRWPANGKCAINGRAQIRGKEIYLNPLLQERLEKS